MPKCPNCGSILFAARIMEETSYDIVVQEGHRDDWYFKEFDYNDRKLPRELMEVHCKVCNHIMGTEWLKEVAERAGNMEIK